MTKSSRVVHHINNSRFRMLLQTQVAAIWPVADREVTIYAYGDAIGDSVAIYTRSTRENVDQKNDLSADLSPEQRAELKLAEEKFSAENSNAAAKNRARNYERFEDNGQFLIPEPEKGQVRAEMIMGGFILTPVTLNSTKVTACFNVDPKLPVIPYSFLNWFTNKLTYMLIKMLRQQCEKYFGPKAKEKGGNDYTKRIEANRRVYGEIERRMLLEMPEPLRSEMQAQKEAAEGEKAS
jgi:hypothetical protein